MGWTLLNNQSIKLYQGTDSIALIGVENSGRPPFPDHARLKEAMNGTEGMFSILLSHDPSHWRREVLPNTDIQLMLSGHTHGGQFNIFGVTPYFIGFEGSKKMLLVHGEKRMGNMRLIVGKGIGISRIPLRIGAAPELYLIEFGKNLNITES